MYKSISFNSLFVYFRMAITRWTFTLAWTALDVFLMLSPGSNGSGASWTSNLFGGTEITDAIGHIILKTILALLWCWALKLYIYDSNLIRWILIGGLIWSFVAELSQSFVPERGVSFVDLGANILGILLGLLVYGTLFRSQHRYSE